MPHDSATLPAWQSDLEALKVEADGYWQRIENRAAATGGPVVRDLFGKAYFRCEGVEGGVAKQPVTTYWRGGECKDMIHARLLRKATVEEVRALWRMCKQTPRPPMAAGQWWEVITD